VCGSYWRVETIQNDGRCHGNQGAKNVKFTPKVFDSIMSIVVPNFTEIGGFLYFGSHFGFKMAAIAPFET
jgi:hypothetical protein